MSPLLVLAPVARVAAIAAGWMLMVVSAATVVEIVGRKLFGFSLRGIDEVSGYALAIVGTVGFSYSLIVRSHMRIALLHGWLPRWARALLDVAAAVTLAAMALFCAWRGYVELAASIESLKPANTPLRTPLWIPQTFWFAGLAFFAVATLSAAVHAVVLAFTDTARLTRLYGPAAIEEEVKAEVSQLETRLGAVEPGGERP